MPITVDCRGMACPQPVVRTKEALGSPGADEVVVIVDNPVAVENVSRFAGSQGCLASVEEREGAHFITLTRGLPVPRKARKVKQVVYINSRRAGIGDDKLGDILMRAFVKTLKELEPPPGKILFLNSGVFLTTEGSPLLDDLKALAEDSVEIYSCGTCLDFYGLQEKLKVGVVSNMFEIVETLAGADSVIRP